MTPELAEVSADQMPPTRMLVAKENEADDTAPFRKKSDEKQETCEASALASVADITRRTAIQTHLVASVEARSFANGTWAASVPGLAIVSILCSRPG